MKILRLVSREEPCDCIASVVLYQNPSSMIENVVNSFLDSDLNVKLYLIDNSPKRLLPASAFDGRPVFYHHVGQNLGYGKGHNWCLRRCEPSRYHLVLNPDVLFSKGILEELIRYMDRNPEIGMISPRILNEDQTLQHQNRRYPTLLDLFLRRFSSHTGWAYLQKRLDHYAMKDNGYEHIYDVPFMTGAFMFCRTAVLRQVGGFDPRFFMYFEDADLSRKFQSAGYKTIYYPHVHITHLWQRASQKRLRMAMVFILSGMKYFNKWGWKLY